MTNEPKLTAARNFRVGIMALATAALLVSEALSAVLN